MKNRRTALLIFISMSMLIAWSAVYGASTTRIAVQPGTPLAEEKTEESTQETWISAPITYTTVEEAPSSETSTVISPAVDAEGRRIQSALGNWFNVGEGATVEDVAYNFLNGHYLVAWSVIDGDGDPDLFAQAFNVYGDPVFSKVKVGERGQSYTQIAYNPSAQEYLIVWDPGYFTVYAQRLNQKGEPLGSKVRIIDNVGATGGALEVVYNFEADEYFVLFNVLKTDLWAVAGQRINADGTLKGDYFWIGEDWFLGGDVVYNPYDNRYLVVGQWGGTGSAGWDIQGQFLASDGSLLGDRFIIESYEHEQESPFLAWNATSNEYLVIWKDNFQDNGTPDIYGRRLRADGGLLGDYIPVAIGDTYTKYPNDLAYDWRSGSYLAVLSVWHIDPETYQEERWSYTRSIELDGGLPLPGSLLWCPTGGEPAATAGYNGKYVVAMEIDGEIWARFVKPWERVYLPLVVRQ
jgi:hypothetical protein